MNYLERHYNEIFKKYSKEKLIKDITSYKLGGADYQKLLIIFLKNVFLIAKAPEEENPLSKH